MTLPTIDTNQMRTRARELAVAGLTSGPSMAGEVDKWADQIDTLGLGPGERVAAPSALRNDPTGDRWECEVNDAGGVFWRPVEDPVFDNRLFRRVCRRVA